MCGLRATVIINPVSGPARRTGDGRLRAHTAASILAALGPLGADVEVCMTERAGHAYDLACAAVARGASLVCAWGGDGTINEVGRALAFGPAALGIVPAGSGNGLAREMNIPFAPREALEHALRAPERRIDVGQIGDRLFFSMAGVGLDAVAAASVPPGRHGLQQYFVAGAKARWSHRPVEYTLGLGEQAVRRRALTIAFANSRQYGYGAKVAPLARLDDGLLDVVVIEARSFAGDAWRVPSLFTGRLHRARGVTMSKVAELQVAAESPMLFHVDGEPVWGGRTLVARVHPGALRVRG